MNKKILTLRLDQETHKALKHHLIDMDLTFQDLMEGMLMDYLNENVNIQSVKKLEEYPEGEFMKTSEAAAILGVSERTIQRKIKAGKVKASKPAKDYLIPIEEVERLKKEEGEHA